MPAITRHPAGRAVHGKWERTMKIPVSPKMRVGWLAAALLVLAGTSPGWTQDVFTDGGYQDGPPPEAQTALAQGKAALEQEQYADAVGLLSKAIRIAEEEYAEAFLLRGQAQMKMEEYQQASASFLKALQQKDELEEDQLAQAYNGLGEAYLEFGPEGVGAALQNFVEATQIEYKNKDYLLNLGTTLVKLRSPDRAIKTLDKVIEMDPQNAAAYDSRGQAHGLLVQGKPEELDLAMADFAKAIEIDRDDKKVYYNMGLVLLQNDRLELAVGAFTQAILKDQAQSASKAQAAAGEVPPAAATPGSEPDQQGAATLPAEGDPTPPATTPATADTAPPTTAPDAAAAAEATTEDKDEGPYIQPYMARALAFTELGKGNTGELRTKAYQLAVADVDQALAMVPRMPDALLIRGVALRLMDDYEGAIASLTEALKLNPQFSEALYRRGIIWFYLGEYDLALSDLKDASLISPRDARPQVWQGYAHAGKGNYHEAVNAYSRALEQNDRFQPALTNRGLAYLQLGQYDKAIGDFNQVIRLEPSNSSAYFRRAIALEMMRDVDQAVASYLFAVQTDRNNVAAYRRLAELYQRQGNADLAQQTRQEADAAAQRVEEAKLAPPPEETLPVPSSAAAVPSDTDLLSSPETWLFPDTGQGLDAAGPDLSLPGADMSLPGADMSLPGTDQSLPGAAPAEPRPSPATDIPSGTSEIDLFN
jgi:tetratricopeptide (TPR) repeat protein